MIFSIIILIVTLVFSVPKIITQMKEHSSGVDFISSIKIPGLVLVVGLLLALFQPFSLVKVDAAKIGLKIALVGDKRGVGDYQEVSGWLVINKATHDFVELPKNIQNVTYETQKTFAKGGFPIHIAPTFNYKVKPEAAGKMFVELRKPLKEIEAGWLNTSVNNAINEVLNLYTVDYIFNNREKVEREIAERAMKKVDRWFIIDQFKANLMPPPVLQDAVANEAKAVKEAQAMAQVAIKEKAAGEAKVAKAKADSAEMVINASAQAEEIRLLQKQLTKEYLELKRTEKWDGRYPTHILGNNVSQFVK